MTLFCNVGVLNDFVMIELRDVCSQIMETPSLPANDLEIVQHYATELYNCCRKWHYTPTHRDFNDEEKRAIVLTRYFACVLLHCTSLNSLLLGNPSSDIIATAPDILRAYKSTAISLKENGVEEEFQSCFAQALKIIDQIEPLLHQCSSGSSFFVYKEAAYDLLMEWVEVLLPTNQPESCLAILTKVRDTCVKYLPDIKLSFVKQVYVIDLLLYLFIIRVFVLP